MGKVIPFPKKKITVAEALAKAKKKIEESVCAAVT